MNTFLHNIKPKTKSGRQSPNSKTWSLGLVSWGLILALLLAFAGKGWGKKTSEN